MYLIAIAAVTNYHKLSNLNNTNLSYSSIGKVQHVSHWAKIKVLAELCPFLEVLGENLFPCLFQILEAAHIPWLVAPFHPLQTNDTASL